MTGVLGRSLLFAFAILASVPTHAADEPKFTALFPEEGPVTRGWLIRTWADVKDAPKVETVWEVRDGILQGGKSSTGQWVGTWLFSEREYGDFILEVEFKFKNGGATGNGGLALRSPLQGRPSFDGFELQITDPRYEFSLYPDGTSDQLTGAIYKAMAPRKQVYNPGEWNSYRVELRGPYIKIWLNDVAIHDVDLDGVNAPIKRPEGGDAFPLSKRPRRGHLGFQDLSRIGEQLLFRNARIAVLD